MTDDLVDTARTHLGDTDGHAWWTRTWPPGRGLPWAGAFLYAVLTETGRSMPPADTFNYYPVGLAEWADQEHLTVPIDDARPGDVAVVAPSWCGIVTGTDPFTVIGGNAAFNDEPPAVIERAVLRDRVVAVIRTRLDTMTDNDIPTRLSTTRTVDEHGRERIETATTLDGFPVDLTPEQEAEYLRRNPGADPNPTA